VERLVIPISKNLPEFHLKMGTEARAIARGDCRECCGVCYDEQAS
jgi:hypothetical protein